MNMLGLHKMKYDFSFLLYEITSQGIVLYTVLFSLLKPKLKHKQYFLCYVNLQQRVCVRTVKK